MTHYTKPEIQVLECELSAQVCNKISFTTGDIDDGTGNTPVAGGDAALFRSGIWDDEDTNPFHS